MQISFVSDQEFLLPVFMTSCTTGSTCFLLHTVLDCCNLLQLTLLIFPISSSTPFPVILSFSYYMTQKRSNYGIKGNWESLCQLYIDCVLIMLCGFKYSSWLLLVAARQLMCVTSSVSLCHFPVHSISSHVCRDQCRCYIYYETFSVCFKRLVSFRVIGFIAVPCW